MDIDRRDCEILVILDDEKARMGGWVTHGIDGEGYSGAGLSW